jgi:hypothetical protein
MDSNHRYPVEETPLCGLPPFHPRNSPSATKTDFCETAWNKDPVFGVIGIQSGPPGTVGPQWLPWGIRGPGRGCW